MDDIQNQSASRKPLRDERLANLAAADKTGWTIHCKTHWYRELCGDRLDYWPSVSKFRWRGETRVGDVMRFIRQEI